MILDQEKITRIKRLLKTRPKGLTISDISQMLKLNRNSVAKYLEILLITGQVEMRLYGNAKVYYLSQRVPISSMLKFATELILILDTDLKIIDMNDNFLSFFSLQKENLIGNDIRTEHLPGLSSIPFGEFIEEPGRAGDGSREIRFMRDGQDHYLAQKTVPTVFDDGSKGFTLIFEDVTLHKAYEQKLRINEARYRAIVEDQTELIVRFNTDFNFTFVNDAVCQYMEIRREELIGTNLFPNIYENDREFVKKNILSLDKEHPFLTHEQRVLDQNGNIRWHQWTNRAIFDESGDIVEYQGVGRDITERKNAEENLLVMNMAIASSINGIAIATLDGIITYANTAFLTIFGIPRLEDILLKPLEMLANPKNPGPGVRVVMQALKERGEWAGEILIIRKDGTQIHTHHTANLVRDKNGVPLAMMASFIDITEKVENEREMKIKDTAIESAINGIIIFDAGEHLIYANQAFLRIFGATSLEDMLQNYMDVFWKIAQFVIPPLEEIMKTLKAKGRWSGEIRVKMPDGMSRFFQLSATQVRDNEGEIICGIGTFMDITDQKAIEKALKTTHEKLQDAVEFMPDPTFIINRDKKVIAWNRALETLSGVKIEDILGTDTYKKALGFLEGTRPILVDILDLPAHELAKSYPNIRRFGDSIFVEAVIPGRQEEGGIYLWGKATPLFDREGNTIGAIESFRDMSEWKKAKETTQPHLDREGDFAASLYPSTCEHRNNLDCLESAFDQLPDGIAILDPQARIQKMNSPFLALLQSKKDEVIGKEFFQVCNSGDVPLVRECLCQSRDNGKRTDTIRIRVGEWNQVTDAEISCLWDPEGAFLGHLVVMRHTSQDLLQR